MMTFQESVKICLTEKFATFQGRASRSEYWWFVLAVVIVGLVASLLGWIVQWIVTLALIVPAAAAGARRLQDTGRPGWWIWIPVIVSLLLSFMAPTMPAMGPDGMPVGAMPGMGSVALVSVLGIVQLVIALVFLWFLTRPSQPGANAYGPPPTA